MTKPNYTNNHSRYALSVAIDVVNIDHRDELQRLVDGDLLEISGDLVDGTSWYATRDSITVGGKRYVAHIRQDWEGLRFYAGTRLAEDNRRNPTGGK